MAERGPAGRPWPALGIGWIIALLVLLLAIILIFVPTIGVPHLDLILIAGLALAILL